jgi:hypothetical protein
VDVAPQFLHEHAGEVLAVTRRHPVIGARRVVAPEDRLNGEGESWRNGEPLGDSPRDGELVGDSRCDREPDRFIASVGQ